MKNKLDITIALIALLVITATVFAIFSLTEGLISTTTLTIGDNSNLMVDRELIAGEEITVKQKIFGDIIKFRASLLGVFFSISLVVAILFFMVSGSHRAQFRNSINKIDSVLMEFEKGNFNVNIPIIDEGDQHPDHLVNRKEIHKLFQRVNILGNRLQQMKIELRTSHELALERADRLASVGELAASIAHEIRNPVAGIINAMQVLSDDVEDIEARTIFEEVQVQAKRVDRAINNLLTYARPIQPELSFTDLNALFE